MIRRVAAIPSVPGIRTSMSTTSGPQRRHLGHRLVAVRRLAHDVQVRLDLEDHPEAGPHQRLVVDDQHADRGAEPASTARHVGSRGSVATSSKPPSRPHPGDERTAVHRDALPHARAARCPALVAASRRGGLPVVADGQLEPVLAVVDGHLGTRAGCARAAGCSSAPPARAGTP